MAEKEEKTANELAVERTDLALERTVMAASRSLMAWIRTSLSLISFGFTGTIHSVTIDVSGYHIEDPEHAMKVIMACQ